MRQELTEGQRVLMGELLPVQIQQLPPPVQAPQEPVQVHVHVGGGGAQATSSFSWLGMLGAITLGIVVYSVYQGQPISSTVASIETAVASAAKPQWWGNVESWWMVNVAPSLPNQTATAVSVKAPNATTVTKQQPVNTENTVTEAKASVP